MPTTVDLTSDDDSLEALAIAEIERDAAKRVIDWKLVSSNSSPSLSSEPGTVSPQQLWRQGSQKLSETWNARTARQSRSLSAILASRTSGQGRRPATTNVDTQFLKRILHMSSRRTKHLTRAHAGAKPRVVKGRGRPGLGLTSGSSASDQRTTWPYQAGKPPGKPAAHVDEGLDPGLLRRGHQRNFGSGAHGDDVGPSTEVIVLDDSDDQDRDSHTLRRGTPGKTRNASPKRALPAAGSPDFMWPQAGLGVAIDGVNQEVNDGVPLVVVDSDDDGASSSRNPRRRRKARKMV